MRKINFIVFPLFFMLIICFTSFHLEKSNGQTNSSSSGQCIFCTQVVPDCSSNEIIVPQSCNECAHCAPASSSSSGDLSCTSDEDCPAGICSSSGTFKNYFCGSGICHQIFYFADPCQFSSPELLNKKFAGVWKGKTLSCISGGGISPNDLGPECVVCPQIAILCVQGSTFVPQTCNECGHCEKCSDLKKIILKLCIKDKNLKGSVHISGIIENGIIISHQVISKNEINVTIQDTDNSANELNLTLTDKRHLSVLLNNDILFKAKKFSFFANCPASTSSSNSSSTSSSSSSSSSSSGENDCSSKGSCRGQNGEELLCPEGTECSGLPAYGCYPPGCPVPICCSPDTKIRTDGVQKRIADIREGELVLTDGGKVVRVKKVSKTPVKNHKILKVLLNDGTVLEISPGHPTADKRKFKDLKMRDILDGRMVVEIKLIPYTYSHTYDILPDSKSGNYYANGVLIGSTLK